MNRFHIAVFGLLAIAVLSAGNLMLDIPPIRFPDIRGFDTHVAEARSWIPDEGSIGYFTDFNDVPGGKDALREYYLMQYALVPVVVEHNLDHRLVITSLHNAQTGMPNRNFSLLHDFGSGVRLLRNNAK